MGKLRERLAMMRGGKTAVAPEGPMTPDAINLGATAIDPKSWIRKPKWDQEGEFIQAEVLILVNGITDVSADGTGNPKHLTPVQAFQLMRMFRLAAAMTHGGIKFRKGGQVLEMVAAVTAAIIPVLTGVQTQFDKKTQATLFWMVNLTSIAFSIIGTACQVIERVRKYKEQGVAESQAGCDLTIELKNFVAGCEPFSDDYRAVFPALAQKFSQVSECNAQKNTHTHNHTHHSALPTDRPQCIHTCGHPRPASACPFTLQTLVHCYLLCLL